LILQVENKKQKRIDQSIIHRSDSHLTRGRVYSVTPSSRDQRFGDTKKDDLIAYYDAKHRDGKIEEDVKSYKMVKIEFEQILSTTIPRGLLNIYSRSMKWRDVYRAVIGDGTSYRDIIFNTKKDIKNEKYSRLRGVYSRIEFLEKQISLLDEL
jgi:hypothetical protein